MTPDELAAINRLLASAARPLTIDRPAPLTAEQDALVHAFHVLPDAQPIDVARFRRDAAAAGLDDAFINGCIEQKWSL